MMKTKTAYYLLSVLFALFAIVQFNDPDPLIWILIYGSVAIIPVLKINLPQVNFNPLIITLIVIMGLYTLAYIPYLVEFLSKPDKSELFGSMNVKKPWIEGTRELFGLLIAMSALIYIRKSRLK